MLLVDILIAVIWILNGIMILIVITNFYNNWKKNWRLGWIVFIGFALGTTSGFASALTFHGLPVDDVREISTCGVIDEYIVVHNSLLVLFDDDRNVTFEDFSDNDVILIMQNVGNEIIFHYTHERGVDKIERIVIPKVTVVV